VAVWTAGYIICASKVCAASPPIGNGSASVRFAFVIIVVVTTRIAAVIGISAIVICGSDGARFHAYISGCCLADESSVCKGIEGFRSRLASHAVYAAGERGARLC
jgi:hypothetical protein